jgi:hypothetical protein
VGATSRSHFQYQSQFTVNAGTKQADCSKLSLLTFTNLPVNQWKSARTTNAIERLHEEFKRRIKTQTVLGGLAEFERELIRARTGEGRARAIERGVKMGRKPKMTPHQIKEALQRRDTGETHREIGRSYNVSHSTISRLAA